MADYDICETGLWVDSDGNVVESVPEGPGVQLVPPGGEMRPDRVKAVEAARAAAPAVVEESVTDPEPEKAPKKAPAKKAPAKAED
jgi:hypothetical protein